MKYIHYMTQIILKLMCSFNII